MAPVRLGPTAGFIHADLGGHNPDKDDLFARTMSPHAEPLLALGGIMVSSDRMYFDQLAEQERPDDSADRWSFSYR